MQRQYNSQVLSEMPRVVAIHSRKRPMDASEKQDSLETTANSKSTKTQATDYAFTKNITTAESGDTNARLLHSSSVRKPPVPANTKTFENRTLWVGDLEKAAAVVTADETYVTYHMFYEFSRNISRVKVCRDRITATPSYAFVEFTSNAIAKYCLEHLNHRWVPGRLHKYKLNWATFNVSDPQPSATLIPSAAAKRRATTSGVPDPEQKKNVFKGTAGSHPGGATTSIWVGSLDPGTTHEDLEKLFSQAYSSVAYAKVVTDPVSGLCRGFGFVHFLDVVESETALGEMNGAMCRGRRIKVNRSNTNKDRLNSLNDGSKPSLDRYVQSALSKLYESSILAAQQSAYQCGYVTTKRNKGCDTDDYGTKLIVRGLDKYCTEDILYRHFASFGQILNAKVAPDRGKGYVTFIEDEAALNAMHFMNGACVGAARISLEPAGYYSEENIETANYAASSYAYLPYDQQIPNYSYAINSMGNLEYSHYSDGMVTAVNSINDYYGVGSVSDTVRHSASDATNFSVEKFDENQSFVLENSFKAVEPGIIPAESLSLVYKNSADCKELDDYFTNQLEIPFIGGMQSTIMLRANENVKKNRWITCHVEEAEGSEDKMELLCEKYSTDFATLVF